MEQYVGLDVSLEQTSVCLDARHAKAAQATVAVARKLAGILHRVCKDGSEFRGSAQEARVA